MSAEITRQASTARSVSIDAGSAASAVDVRTPTEDELRRLRGLIEDLRAQQGAHDDQLQAVAAEMASMRGFRERTESELSKLRVDLSTLASVVDEMARLPPEVRAQFQPELDAVRDQLQLQLTDMQRAEASTAPQEAKESPQGERAAEVPRFGAPAPALCETGGPAAHAPDPAAPEPAVRPPDGAELLVVPRFELPEQPLSWLADAIRGVAHNRDAGLAAELIVELLPAHGLLVGQPLAYLLSIDEIGAYTVHTGAGHATVTSTESVGGTDVDFMLTGPAAAFAPLVGGGAGRRLSGLGMHGSRRKARELLRACRPPLALGRCVDAGLSVWPGLLLLALAETVQPAWTVGSNFLVRFAIDEGAGAMIYVRVDGAAPVSVSATRDGEADEQSTIYTSERAFLSLVAGRGCPSGEDVLCDGPIEPAHLLLGWFARGQGASHAG